MMKSVILFARLTISVLICVCVSDSKVSFTKDQTLNAVFPAKLVPSIQGLPDGHLRPLGWQKQSEGRIREEKQNIDPHAFYLRYIKAARPVTLRQMLKGQAVIETWEEDEYLEQKYGGLNLTVIEKRERLGDVLPRHMLFRQFLEDYDFMNWYLANTVPQEMEQELPLPAVLKCGTYKERLIEAEFWMSSGGATSLLHSHDSNNIHCVLHGRKDFILIDHQYKKAFDFKEDYPQATSGHSSLDMNRINLFRTPKVAKVPWVWTTLMSGDCIYLPVGQLHQVRSYGRSISYTVQFAPSAQFDSSDCRATPGEEESKKSRRKKKKQSKEKKDETMSDKDGGESVPQQLSHVNFVWAFKDGYKRLSDSNLTSPILKRILLLLLGDKDNLPFDQFRHFYSQVELGAEIDSKSRRVFDILTGQQDKQLISKDELTGVPNARLKKICDIVNEVYQQKHDEL